MSDKQKPNFFIFPFSKFCQNACRWSFTIVLTNYDGLGLCAISGKYDAPSAGIFKEGVENV